MARILRFLVQLYRYSIGTVLPNSCRFHPTCSQYALDALCRHGAGRGSLLAIRRICRCHPFSVGGYDPVPEPPTHVAPIRPQTDTGDNLEVR